MSIDKLAPGCRVEVVGLVKKPENNGRKGSVVEYLEDIQKYYVMSDGGQSMKLKRENLEVINATSIPLPEGRPEPVRATATSRTESSMEGAGVASKPEGAREKEEARTPTAPRETEKEEGLRSRKSRSKSRKEAAKEEGLRGRSIRSKNKKGTAEKSPSLHGGKREKGRSRSQSRRTKRSKSKKVATKKSPTARGGTREKSKSRSPRPKKPSRSRSRKKRSRSRSRRRSRSRSRKKSRSRTPKGDSKRKRARSRSRSRSRGHRRSRSPQQSSTGIGSATAAQAKPDARSLVAGGSRSRSRGRRKSQSPQQPSAGVGAGIGFATVAQAKPVARPLVPGGGHRAFQMSKALALVLRHKAVEMGLKIRADGFCALDDVLNLPIFRNLQAKPADMEEVTRTNEKKRFEMSVIDGRCMIRAVQGHSLKVVQDTELLTRLDLQQGPLPEKCVHGTFSRHWASIVANGLIAGGTCGQGQRNHIHFAPYDSNDRRVISGMRPGCDVAVYLDLRRAMTDGIPFFMAKNEVILSPGLRGVIPTKYFQLVKNLMTGAVLYP
mmetsp:Transcript_109256/g.308207  ORF Transcript_109256/g.308207 Transcript_109256/m.308207 type:complete len:550 (-) Transcript_109256:49-1698(-)